MQKLIHCYTNICLKNHLVSALVRSALRWQQHAEWCFRAVLLWILVTSCGYSTTSFGQDLGGELPQNFSEIGEIPSQSMSNDRNPNTWLQPIFLYDEINPDSTQKSNGVQDAENELSRQSEEELAANRQRLEQAVDLNHLDAKGYLRENYLHGIGGRRDVEAYKLLEQASDGGDAAAQRILATMYRHGIDGAQDLAKMLSEGPNAEQDKDQISTLFFKAAESGNPGAQVEYGVWLQAQGQYEKAFDWFSKAANQNDVDGIVQIANAYRDGIGTVQNLIEARKLFDQAASQGHPVGQTQLAKILLTEGNQSDVAAAVELLKRASLQDHAPALLAAAQLYVDGNGVAPDLMMAYQLGRRSAELGFKEAIEEEPKLLQYYCKSNPDSCITRPVLYLTDREVTSDSRLDYLYSNSRQIWPDGEDVNQTALHYGVVMVTVPLDQTTTVQKNWWDQFGQQFWQMLNPSSQPRPNTDTIIRKIHPLTRVNFGELLQNQVEIQDHRRVMVFVHGFNNSFSFAARRLAEFSSRINYQGVVVMFSWPSSNKLSLYMKDYDETEQSCPRFTFALNTIHQFTENAPIDVVAHSMGAKLLHHSLTAGKGGRCEAPRVELNDIVLAAPDISVSTFKESLGKFGKKNQQVTLYASSKDTALLASSSVLRGGAPRLGQGGENLTVLEGMHSLDASRIERNIVSDLTAHAYVFVNEIVVRDLQELLMNDKEPDSRSCLRSMKHEQLTYWIFEHNGKEICSSG